MIAFSTNNVLESGNFGADGCHGTGGNDFILSIKFGGGHCTSKVLAASVGVPRLLTLIMVLGAQADIVAVPELYASVYVPWHVGGDHRAAETAHAFLNAGLREETARCLAIAVNIIYDVIDRDYVDYCGTARDCIFTSSGMMELNDDCREKVFSGGHVLSEFPIADEDDLPF